MASTLRLVRDVGDRAVHPVGGVQLGQRGQAPLQPVLLPLGHGHARPVGHQVAGHAQADPLAGPGHDDPLPLHPVLGHGRRDVDDREELSAVMPTAGGVRPRRGDPPLRPRGDGRHRAPPRPGAGGAAGHGLRRARDHRRHHRPDHPGGLDHRHRRDARRAGRRRGVGRAAAPRGPRDARPGRRAPGPGADRRRPDQRDRHHPRRVAEQGIACRVDHVFNSAEIGHAKPDARAFQHVLECSTCPAPRSSSPTTARRSWPAPWRSACTPTPSSASTTCARSWSRLGASDGRRGRPLPAPAAHGLPDDRGAGPAGRGARLPLGLVHGPPDAARRARLRLLRGLDGRRRAGPHDRAHPPRPPRPLRRLPPPRPAGQDGRHPRRHHRGPAGAGHRLGLGARRDRALRLRPGHQPRAGRPPRRDPAGPGADVLRRGVRLRRPVLPAPRRRRPPAPAPRDDPDPPRRGGRAAHPAARGEARRLVELPVLRGRPPRRAAPAGRLGPAVRPAPGRPRPLGRPSGTRSWPGPSGASAAGAA